MIFYIRFRGLHEGRLYTKHGSQKYTRSQKYKMLVKRRIMGLKTGVFEDDYCRYVIKQHPKTFYAMIQAKYMDEIINEN